MSGEYISRETTIKSTWMILEGMGYPRSENRSLERTVEAVFKSAPAADVVEVVRCRDCKHRIVNENYGKKGYLKLKAMCELDTGDPFEFGRNAKDDDWFCADGERKDGGQEK